MHFKGDLLFMKELNRRLILDTIRRLGSLSRATIAKETKLNPSTVTRIIQDLINEGFVQEIGYATSQGGRKPILVDLVPNVVNIIGVNVETTKVIGIISNLTGEILSHLEIPIEDYRKEAIFKTVSQVINQLLSTPELKKEPIGIGIAMHGLVDVDKGIVLYPPAFGWRDLPIVDLLESRFKLPVKLENNARALALGEWWFGAGRGLTNFIALKVGYGIGSGIILNGEIFRGVNFTAGEIGHTTVTVDGPLCDCGNYGCLESLASVKALVKRAKRGLKEGRISAINSLSNGNPELVKPEYIFMAAEVGDELALEILQEAGRYLGITLANLTNILNPTKILLGGDILAGLDYILPTIKATVQARAMEIPAKRLQIQPIELGTNAVAIGATTLILQQIFQPATAK